MRSSERTLGVGRLPWRAHGFTLIELTVVLAVIVTLALILTPSFANYINDARTARARSDAQTIASAVVQFYKDNGFYPQWAVAQNGGPGTTQDKVDLLVTPGNTPLVTQPNLWTTGISDAAGDQLVANAPAYRLRTAAAAFGWNGPYLTAEPQPDPWNNRYTINVGLIDAGAGVQTAGGATKSAVWVLSAGPNGTIETAYNQPVTGAVVGGDDIATRIQ